MEKKTSNEEISTSDPTFLFLKREKCIQEWMEKLLNRKFLTNNLPEELSDGIYLCRVMRTLDKSSIPVYYPDPVEQQKKDNLFFFNEAIKEYGVNKNFLFTRDDLCEKKNLPKVYSAIEQLSMVATEKKFPIAIETEPEGEIEITKEKYESTSLMLKIFHDILMKRKAVRMESLEQNLVHSVIPTELVEKLKGVDLEKLLPGIIKLQAHARRHAAKLQFQRLKRQYIFRTEVAKEILNSERIYIRNLDILINHYYRPLQEKATQGKLITETQIRSLFSDIEVIRNYGKRISELFEPRIAEWSPSQCLGDIFLQFTGFMKVYTNYVQRYDEGALMVLLEMRKKSKFIDFCKKAQKEYETNIGDIEMLLILPIQRLPRYTLLLKELLKYTQEDHRDYPALSEAFDKMKDVATSVNEKKREFENRAKVRLIESTLLGTEELTAPHRKFVRSDVFAKWTGHNDIDKKTTLLNLTLFNDLLVVSLQNSKNSSLRFKGMYNLNQIVLLEPRLRKWAQKNSISFAPKRANSDRFTRPKQLYNNGGRSSSSSGGSSPSSENNSPVDSPRQGRVNSFLRRTRGETVTVSYSTRYTVEVALVKTNEVVVKFCCDSPLSYAIWTNEFKAVKKEWDDAIKFREETKEDPLGSRKSSTASKQEKEK